MLYIRFHNYLVVKPIYAFCTSVLGYVYFKNALIFPVIVALAGLWLQALNVIAHLCCFTGLTCCGRVTLSREMPIYHLVQPTEHPTSHLLAFCKQLCAQGSATVASLHRISIIFVLV